MHFNCAAEYSIENVRENQEALEVNRTHLLSVSVEDVNLLDKNINNKEKTISHY
jgi:hypothetical protein